MNRKHLLASWALAAMATLPLVALEEPAFAQERTDKERALDAYKLGTTQYNLGKWDTAIGHFEQAFEILPDAAFLFNIAQSHRQAGNCKKAQFFYKRYLALKPDASNKAEVEAFIQELESGCATPPPQSGTTSTAETPSDPANPPTKISEATASTDAAMEANYSLVSAEPSTGPSLLVAHVALGSSVLFFGDELETPPQFNLTVGAGYPIAIGDSMQLDAGLLLSYSPVSWETDSSSGTTGFTGLMANAGLTMELASSISARAELGAGLMIVSGLGDGENVFIPQGMSADDPSIGPALRAALGAELKLTSSLRLSVQPLVLSASSAPANTRESIGAITSYQALVGLGYEL